MLEHERVVVVRGARTGLAVVVAVHSTARGPAIGGCRLRRYPSWRAGLDDALALSAAMTDKAALAGLDHGGGKTVAVLSPEPLDAVTRAALIEDVADVVGSLGGSYLAGPDIGTGPADMAVIHERTGSAFCRPVEAGGSGDSSEATAHGVLAALLAGAEQVFGRRSLTGRRIGVLGLGGVGLRLTALLGERGALLTTADIDQSLRASAHALGARWTSPAALLAADLDILVPAAVGGILTHNTVATVTARLVVGPANNQLAAEDVADALARRGIVWVPDVVASAGGIVRAVSVERHGRSGDEAAAQVAAIGDTVADILAEAARRRVTPHRVAADRARALRRGSQR